MCANFVAINVDLKSVGAPQQDDVDQRSTARATEQTDDKPKSPDEEIPPKKRKTRRGKNKRRHPYNVVGRKTSTVVKPVAPHNSNQFLIEDHGHAIELDEKLIKDKIAIRTRNSSFSVDSDDEFYSSPDDEEEFLIKDFDDQYESLHAERLNSMSKTELIQEYVQLEKKVEVLTKRLRSRSANLDISETDMPCSNNSEIQKQMELLINENELLKRENNDLRNKISVSISDSEDSESDSSDTCSSCSSHSSIQGKSAPTSPSVDYTCTNGHSPNNLQPV